MTSKEDKQHELSAPSEEEQQAMCNAFRHIQLRRSKVMNENVREALLGKSIEKSFRLGPDGNHFLSARDFAMGEVILIEQPVANNFHIQWVDAPLKIATDYKEHIAQSIERIFVALLFTKVDLSSFFKEFRFDQTVDHLFPELEKRVPALWETYQDWDPRATKATIATILPDMIMANHAAQFLLHVEALRDGRVKTPSAKSERKRKKKKRALTAASSASKRNKHNGGLALVDRQAQQMDLKSDDIPLVSPPVTRDVSTRSLVRVKRRHERDEKKTVPVPDRFPQVSQETFWEWIGMIHYNLMPIESSTRGFQLNLAFCLACSKLLRSCDPNVTYLPNIAQSTGTRELWLVATQEIKEGQTLRLPHARLQEFLCPPIARIPSNVHRLNRWSCTCGLCPTDESSSSSSSSSSSMWVDDGLELPIITGTVTIPEHKEKKVPSIGLYSSLPAICATRIQSQFTDRFPQSEEWTKKVGQLMVKGLEVFLQLKRTLDASQLQELVLVGFETIQTLLTTCVPSQTEAVAFVHFVIAMLQPLVAQSILAGFADWAPTHLRLYTNFLLTRGEDYWIDSEGEFPRQGYQIHGLCNLWLLNTAVAKIYVWVNSHTGQSSERMRICLLAFTNTARHFRALHIKSEEGLPPVSSDEAFAFFAQHMTGYGAWVLGPIGYNFLHSDTTALGKALHKEIDMFQVAWLSQRAKIEEASLPTSSAELVSTSSSSSTSTSSETVPVSTSDLMETSST